MVLQITVPDEYTYVLFSTTVVPFVTSTIMGGRVMSARQRLKVQYPNLYAVPGYHDKADEFNRVQRGHQNLFETIGSVTTMLLVGGLQSPRVATALALAYCAGMLFKNPCAVQWSLNPSPTTLVCPSCGRQLFLPKRLRG